MTFMAINSIPATRILEPSEIKVLTVERYIGVLMCENVLVIDV